MSSSTRSPRPPSPAPRCLRAQPAPSARALRSCARSPEPPGPAARAAPGAPPPPCPWGAQTQASGTPFLHRPRPRPPSQEPAPHPTPRLAQLGSLARPWPLCPPRLQGSLTPKRLLQGESEVCHHRCRGGCSRHPWVPTTPCTSSLPPAFAKAACSAPSGSRAPA